ncbi:FHA domain-containing protein [Methylomonas rivi]|uniref:FHA domain-containing protein n=1 Tax=Methylomonas rivi TaxID=2952226 RepID=A0ABT1U592_9GAMM|nr:FHA domain-containing protein [Methylomonas sp. WSC-6]MCQ8129024.1 FHA domain-containing protein [Methylomonas sp. WSC-6]
MAKFTLYFKDKPIYSGIYDAGVVHIGRDDSNDIVVDSLAVAPAHAVAVIKEGSCVVKQLNEKFPLLINNQATKEWSLQNNDVVNVGKHYIVYTLTESFLDAEPFTPPSFSQDADVQALNRKLEQAGKPQEANLQIMDGPHIGRILPLKKAMTRLGHEGAGVVVIARRKDGYYVSALQGHSGLAVNKQPLGDNTVLLQHNDVIEVDKTPMQFFLE